MKSRTFRDRYPLPTAGQIRFLARIVAIGLALAALWLASWPASGASALVQDDPPPSSSTTMGLRGSQKFASKRIVVEGEELAYTIRLRNSGPQAAIADVTDLLPGEVSYVEGSAEPEATYDDVEGSLSWSAIEVPAWGDALLTFSALAGDVDAATLITNTAVIEANDETLERHAWVTLVPESAELISDLSCSQKFASARFLAPGETLTYAIRLRNCGLRAAVADVTDLLPEEVTFVDGSARPEAIYDSDAGTLSWTAVEVPGRSDVLLTFQVTGPAVDTPLLVTNTARIETGDETLERYAWVTLVPEPAGPTSDLSGSQKFASAHFLAPGETLTYAIRLRNSGLEAALAGVTDLLPEEVIYVEGSAEPAATYDDVMDTLSWSAVEVPARSDVLLTFQVTGPDVEAPKLITNTAVIEASDETLERHAWVLLVPGRPGPASDPSGSQKFASARFLGPDETLTYTIRLRNSGSELAVADVTDLLPEELTYVDGSAEPAATYDDVEGTLTWTAIEVPARSDVLLTFQVTGPTVDTPLLVTNTARIEAGDETLERYAWVTLVPEAPGPRPNLTSSHKFASARFLAPGEPLTYTIRLRNSGQDASVADVSDLLPEEVTYVDGSAEPAATYDGIEGTLAWTGVEVPGWGGVDLTFQVTGPTVEAPQLITNTVVITAGEETLERSAWVTLVPEPAGAIRPNLSGSYKAASQRVLGPGEALVYSVHLHNSGTEDALARVTDQVPALMTYEAGSASHGATYDEETRTLSWRDIPVPVEGDVVLSFTVTGATVDAPTEVRNTAQIAGDGRVHNRHVKVVLVPDPPPSDLVPPVVDSLTIGEQDVLADPEVTLHIRATDDTGVRWMYLREWQWLERPWPHWRSGHSSGWIPYQEDYPWTLNAESGVHFVGVWVADAALNISHMGRKGLDYASLLLPETTVGAFGVVPYMVYYEAGVDVVAELTIVDDGDAGLYVWRAGSFLSPISVSDKRVEFTTPRAGTYMFVVQGQPTATYDLSIEPAGGPRVPLAADPGTGNVIASAGAVPGDAGDLLSLLTYSGLDPLDGTEAPPLRFGAYLPLVIKGAP